MNTIMDAATRVAGTPCKNDALFEALALVVPHKQQFVMVTGPSGSGKSRLVSETIKCLEEQNWCHLCCKFDKIVYAHPLSIIAGAFNQHLELCLTKNSSHIEISKNLKQNMQSKDVSQLSKHVPCLLKYVDDLQPDDSEVDQEQLHQLFCQLLDIISDISKLVFFVDDLQWMDAASIGLLFALTKANASALDGYDSKRSNVLFVGCYRDNGLDESPRLVKMIDDLERCSSVEVTSIDVYGFVIEELNARLMV
jgi:predicted ATPase